NGSSFLWVADKPYHVHDGRYNHFVPAEVIGSRSRTRSIRLFVRPESSQEYLYLGELSPSFMQQAPGPQNHGMAQFELRPTLPSTIWSQLGGFQVRDTDDASLDQALDRLRSPTTIDDRLE